MIVFDVLNVAQHLSHSKKSTEIDNPVGNREKLTPVEMAPKGQNSSLSFHKLLCQSSSLNCLSGDEYNCVFF